jgi:hypothetical protein
VIATSVVGGQGYDGVVVKAGRIQLAEEGSNVLGWSHYNQGSPILRKNAVHRVAERRYTSAPNIRYVSRLGWQWKCLRRGKVGPLRLVVGFRCFEEKPKSQ